MNVLEQQKGQKHRLSNKIAPQENHQKTQKKSKKNSTASKGIYPLFLWIKEQKKVAFIYRVSGFIYLFKSKKVRYLPPKKNTSDALPCATIILRTRVAAPYTDCVSNIKYYSHYHFFVQGSRFKRDIYCYYYVTVFFFPFSIMQNSQNFPMCAFQLIIYILNYYIMVKTVGVGVHGCNFNPDGVGRLNPMAPITQIYLSIHSCFSLMFFCES